jgi:hypothetical protein
MSRTILITLVMGLLGALSPVLAQDTTTPVEPIAQFYIAPDGNDDWSGLLPEPTEANDNGPFRTVERAQSVVEALIADGMTGSVEVIFRGGEYLLNQIIYFGPNGSGRDGFEVIYRNMAGEVPVLRMARRVTGWEAHDANIYQARVGAGTTFSTLYENDQHSQLAQSPNQGYYHTVSLGGSQFSQFAYAEGEFPALANTDSLRAYIWPAGPDGNWNWYAETIPVASVDAQSRQITLAHPALFEIGGAGGSRYRLQGALELLDSPGEFYLDSTAGTLYYWPLQLPIEDQAIFAPIASRVMGFYSDDPERPVENIRIEGLTFSNTDALPAWTYADDLPDEDGAIFMDGVRQISIIGCRIANVGVTGIYLNRFSDSVTLAGNLIEQVGYHGISLSGSLARDSINHGHQIVNNHIHHTGQLIGHGTGIALWQSARNRIAHNRIHHTPRYSISLMSNAPHTLVGQTINEELIIASSAPDFVRTRENVVEFNDLSHANLDSGDTGVIQSWGTVNSNNRIENNYIHDSNVPLAFGYAIFLDDGSGGFSVRNNYITNLQNSGEGQLAAVIMVKGVNNEIVNNLSVNNPRAQSGLSSRDAGQEESYGTTILNNIFYESGVAVYNFLNWNDNRLSRVDANLYFNRQERYDIILSGIGIPPRDFRTWRFFRAARFDQQSLTEDPLFMDATNGDFRLRPNSPALALGFQELDFARMGLLPDFPYVDATEPLERVYILSDVAGPNATIQLQPVQTAQLSLQGRTASGYVADLSDATITYQSDLGLIAQVDATGLVIAESAGLARITAIVEQRGVTRIVSVYVQVSAGE